MSDRKFKSVTKEELQAFVRAYPRKLVPDVAGMYEPPLVTFNDFTLAEKWPESIVASYRLAGYGPEDGYQVLDESVE